MIRVKRTYQFWVANETLEDYSLRYAARSYRKWPSALLANTALGGISFLALEAIGGAITLSYGSLNALFAIVVVSLIIFLTSLPITYYSSKYNVDMDLLTRGAGFGYIGSTITSLIYASFTFIFFALEAAIMAQALKLYYSIPIVVGYVVSSLIIIPLVFFGVTLINRLQIWTQPLWIVLLVIPFIFIFRENPDILEKWYTYGGRDGYNMEFDLLLFGAAAGVLFSLVPQIGEQVDYLRFLPQKTRANRFGWWASMLSAGPGWIILGGLKILAGGFLAFLALGQGLETAQALEPIHMYIAGYGFVFDNPQMVLGFATLFVIVSQVKINVTNAYAGSLAWSNFFARLTHFHAGRVVWLVFNVLIALMLMLLGIFETLEAVLRLYSNVAIAWIGAIVADLVVLKPLGISPPYIEFKRAHLYDINPVGCGAMLVASIVSIVAYAGGFGYLAEVYSAFIALGTAFLTAIVIGMLTDGKYYIARENDYLREQHPSEKRRCCICELEYEGDDMAVCPFYDGPICSLCCSLDNHCRDVCKTPNRLEVVLQTRSAPSLSRPAFHPSFRRRIGRFLSLYGLATLVTAAVFLLSYRLLDVGSASLNGDVAEILLRIFLAMMVLIAIGVWWIVLSHESEDLARSELVNSLRHLEMTRKELIESEKMASLGGLVAGVAHEINTPLGIMVGAASHLRDKVRAVRRSLLNGGGDRGEIETFMATAEQSSRLLLANAERAATLIQSFKQMAVDQTTDERRVFDLREYVQETLVSLQPKLTKQSHDISVSCPPDILVDSYPGPFAQVLTNLAMNSFLHAYEEGQTGNIRVNARVTEEDWIELRFSDDGKGMGADTLSKVFEPFFTSRRSEGGTGLGLHLAYNIVTRKLGGSIEARSTEGEGTTFVVRIPRVFPPLPHPAGAATHSTEDFR